MRVYSVFVYHNKFVTSQAESGQHIQSVERSEMDCKIVDLSVSDVR